jgi:hypothetical protein
VWISGKAGFSAAMRGTPMDILFRRRSGLAMRIAAKIAGRLPGGRAAMHKLDPFEVVLYEVIESRRRYFNPCAVCERNRHSPLPENFLST